MIHSWLLSSCNVLGLELIANVTFSTVLVVVHCACEISETNTVHSHMAKMLSKTVCRINFWHPLLYPVCLFLLPQLAATSVDTKQSEKRPNQHGAFHSSPLHWGTEDLSHHLCQQRWIWSVEEPSVGLVPLKNVSAILAALVQYVNCVGLGCLLTDLTQSVPYLDKCPLLDEAFPLGWSKKDKPLSKCVSQIIDTFIL